LPKLFRSDPSDVVAFAAATTLVAGAAYDVVQEALAFDEFACQDVLSRDI
jgi:hypothetical protein